MSHKYLQAAVVALSLGACAQMASNQDFGFGGPENQNAIISVENQYFGQVTVYVLDGPSRTRLGSVTPFGTEDFRVPGKFIGINIQLQATPLTPGAGFTSQYLVISPGSNVVLRLANDLPLSHYSFR